MGESFYTLLGVGDDADGDAIERAYRERVKKHHPDVSDTPGAREKFKRLTVARDTLVDGDERFRYDTMGHEAYVEKHVRDGLFDIDGSAASDDVATTAEPSPDGATQSETASPAGSSAAEQAWVSATRAASSVAADGGEHWRSNASATGSASKSASASSATSTIYDSASTTHSDSVEDSTAADLWETVRSFGPWLLVYLLAVVSVVTVAWPVFAGGVATSSAMVAVFVSVMIVVTIAGAALHFVSMLA